MAESGGVSVTHEEVEAFVGKLKDFHGSLDDPEQVMLVTILKSAQGGETGGYRWAARRSEDPSEESSESSSGWNDLIGWIEEQGDEDTQGFSPAAR